MAKLFPLLLGVLATFIFRQCVAIAFDPPDFFYTLILPEGGVFERAVPVTILFLFFWILGDLAVKIRSNYLQNRALSQPSIQGASRSIGSFKIDEAIRGIQQARGLNQDGHLVRRIAALLEHLKFADDPQRTHEFMRHQTDLDSDAVASSYTTVRVFIWAMPILGFIGTVIGISLAVGDFSGFLSGNIDDIDLVKRELANVSNGLSFAFNTTLLGLVASLVAMMLTTYVQKQDELLARNVEELFLDIVASSPRDQSKPSFDLNNAASIASMQQFADILGKESQRLREGIDSFNSRLLDVGGGIVDTYSELGVAVERQANVFTQQMSGLTAQLTDAMSSTLGALTETTSSLSRDFAALSPELGDMRNAITRGLDYLGKSDEIFENVIRTNMQEVVTSQEKLGEIFTAGLEGLGRSNGEVQEILQANARQIVTSQENLGHKIDAIRPSQELIVGVSQSLDDCQVVLRQVKEVHETMLSVLQELKGPMEFKMVPVSQKADSDSV